MLGVPEGKVVLEEFDREWENYYQLERNKLLTVENIMEIEHIGSTNIKEMIAKPIIDIGFIYKKDTDIDGLIESIESLGYEFLGERGVNGRSFFVKREEDSSKYHLHGYVEGDEQYKDHIIFRDYLNDNEKYREEYKKLKNDLFLKYEGDRQRYTLGKAIFIKFILKKAKL